MKSETPSAVGDSPFELAKVQRIEGNSVHWQDNDDYQRWVRESDYDTLLALYKAMEAENESLKAKLESTQRELSETYENLVIVRMQDNFDLTPPQAAWKLYTIWQDALHKPHDAHPENIEIKKLFADREKMVEVLKKYRREHRVKHSSGDWCWCNDSCDTCKLALLLEGK